MKLLTKSTLIYLTVTLLVFLAGGFIFYYQLKNIMDEELTEEFSLQKEQIIKETQKTGQLPVAVTGGDFINFIRVNEPVAASCKDTMIYVESYGEILPYRQIGFNVSNGGKNYKALLSKPTFESDDLIETITTSFIILALVLIAFLLLINFIISKSIFKPFFKTLNTINNYSVEQHTAVTFETSKTVEFNQLNEAIGKMTERISSDFNNLKAFAENASHELQTPLAIIKTKSELLMQRSGITEEFMRELSQINQTASKAAKLNQTLLLLSKIENNQFQSKAEVSLAEIIKRKINLYDDLFSMKDIVATHFIQDIKVPIHPELADIIISNLLTNAIKYTPVFGTVEIELSKEKLTVSNSGQPLKSDPEKLFNRFYKEDAGSESTGLGLALVKQIAILNEHAISYEYTSGMHVFTYKFN